MKKYLTALALVALVASPVLAQSYDPDVGSGNIAPAPYAENTAYDAFAMAPRAQTVAHVSKTKAVSSDVVKDEAGNLEQDPDKNIRSQLIRENNED